MIFSSRRFLQKTNERILLYYYETSGRLIFVCFLEEIEDTIKTFRNYLTFRKMFLWGNLENKINKIPYSLFIKLFLPFQALIIEKSMHKIKDEPFDDNDIEKFCLKLNRDMNDILNVYLQHNVIQEHESFSRTKVL